ncbi:MAG: DUF1549 domain-containing protein, partial [Planctomycetales bacterium]|nr:DUF1549 domain-containing protein [Planctomycetales bacterium]
MTSVALVRVCNTLSMCARTCALVTLHCSILLCLARLAGNSAAAATPVDFNRTIRPILADHCFACHGPDESKRAAGLRLDTLDGQHEPADSGAIAIVVGKPEASELVARITSDDSSSRMPPPEADNDLTEEEIALLQQWIRAGAPWQRHWAYEPPQRPELPSIKNSAWPRNEIDHFILSRLEAADLTPERDAHPVTLVRRVYQDLTGLPPKPAQVQSYVDDTRHDAYERLVDRILESPAYGEHLARYWLDAARYGDTHGLHLDNYREIWPYRDWVIRAFNSNMPFDRFTTAQLAGDLLPSATRDDLIATGFNRCHVTTNEGGSIADEIKVRNVVDRVTTVGTVFMGMTLECTRCHDHKYDPLTMDDFYSLYAYFNSLDGEPMDGNRKDHPPVIGVPTESQQLRTQELDNRIAALEQQVYGNCPPLDAEQAVWEATPVEPIAGSAESPIAFTSWYAIGPFSEVERYLYSRKHGPETNDNNRVELQ